LFTIPVWLNVAPWNVVVDLWHVSQDCVVGTCVAALARAVVVPLWQVVQPLTIPVWLNVVPWNVVVDLWQVSHACVVGTCVAVLARAWVPLWQPAQVPGTTPEWLKLDTANQFATPTLWQLSHEADVDMWPAGFPRA
jgi:hypothetical protein